MSPIQLSGAVLTGLAALLSANVAGAGCNCGVPPAPMASMGAWSGGDMPYQPHPMAAQYQPMSPGGYSGSAFGTGVSYHGAPGGYEARIGSPVYYHDPAGGQFQVSGDPHQDHYGPGFQRHSLHGHYRFPYYNYRAPWYYPGRAVYNRDTNFAW